MRISAFQGRAHYIDLSQTEIKANKLMDTRAAIKNSLDMAEMVSMSYLNDLSDAELMQRPHPECNHLNWQIGHLVASENQLMTSIAAEQVPALPKGFSDKYSKDSAGSNDPSQFAAKEELLSVYRAQRDATLAVLQGCSDQELDMATGVDYAPTKGAMIALQGAHWMMHCGQWVIVRRQLGKPIVI